MPLYNYANNFPNAGASIQTHPCRKPSLEPEHLQGLKSNVKVLSPQYFGPAPQKFENSLASSP